MRLRSWEFRNAKESVAAVTVAEVIVAEVAAEVAAAALWVEGNEFVPSMIRRKSLRGEKRGRMAVGGRRIVCPYAEDVEPTQ